MCAPTTSSIGGSCTTTHTSIRNRHQLSDITSETVKTDDGEPLAVVGKACAGTTVVLDDKGDDDKGDDDKGGDNKGDDDKGDGEGQQGRQE